MRKVKVFASATIANLGPGFDMMGVAIDGIGDEVSACRVSDPAITGVQLIYIHKNPSGLTVGPENVVTAVGRRVQGAAKENGGVELVMWKHMKLRSGMGSSAASSAASGWSVNNVLEKPFERNSQALLDAVAYGEEVACGSAHCDNVYPSLLGGAVVLDPSSKSIIHRFEGFDGLYFAVISPNMELDTRTMRDALKKSPYNIGNIIKECVQIAKEFFSGKAVYGGGQRELCYLLSENNPVDFNEAARTIRKYQNGFLRLLSGFQEKNAKLIGESVMMDDIITPLRAKHIPGYKKAKMAALRAGAYGFCISGSGPAVFLIAPSEKVARLAASQAASYLCKPCKIYVSQVNNHGARIVEAE